MSSNKNQQNKIMVLSENRELSRDLGSQASAIDSESLKPSQIPSVQAKDFFQQGLDKFNRGDDRAALERFNQVLRLNPDCADAYSFRARIRSKKGDHVGAIQDYSEVLRVNPQDVEAYSSRGFVRAESGDRWGAMQDYNQALQLASSHIKTYLNRSLLRVELEDYQGAIEDCNAVLTINPNLPKAYLNRGLAHFELEDYQNAMTDYNQALQINSNLAEGYFDRGLNYVALNQYQDAIADFNQAITINPNYTQAYLNRGYTRMQLGDNWGSIEDFDQALKIDPVSAKTFFSQMAHIFHPEQETFEDENQQLIQGLIIQGNLRYESGDYQAALDAYNQALNLDANNAEIYNRRSTVRSAMRDYKGALEDLEKAKTLSLNHELSSQTTPGFTVQPTAKEYHQRGVAKLQQGDFQEAIEDFNQVLQMKGDDATTLTCRGFAYQRLGDNQRAIEDLQAAATLFFEQGDVKSSEEVLETLKKIQ
jgi:tetratricopeptide (TPR) repeat protein